MIPEPGHTDLNFPNFIILLGVVQGILLTITGLAQARRKSRLKALLFFSITCIITEIFLNRTGYMYYVIQLVDFSEPLQFAVPPLIYLIVRSLDPRDKIRKAWLHFIPFLAYLVYFMPFYLAPQGYKSESYYFMHHFVDWNSSVQYEFLKLWGELRMFQMLLCFFQTTIYMVLCFQVLFQYKINSENDSAIDPFEVKWWIIFNGIITLLIAVILVVKVTYIRDIGDHIIAIFFTFLLYFSALSELIKPSRTILSIPPNEAKEDAPRYLSSPMKEEKKEEIQQKLLLIMQDQKLYTDCLISLAKISRQIGEPVYMVSQVINEKLDSTFYDWIAKYRVEEAKRMLLDTKTESYTIEQIAEEVGYNSKSAFNKAFKKFTGQTPSQFRNS